MSWFFAFHFADDYIEWDYYYARGALTEGDHFEIEETKVRKNNEVFLFLLLLIFLIYKRKWKTEKAWHCTLQRLNNGINSPEKQLKHISVLPDLSGS